MQPAAEDPEVVVEVGPGGRWVAEYYPHDSADELPEGGLRISLRTPEPASLRRLALRLGRDGRIVSPQDSPTVPAGRPVRRWRPTRGRGGGIERAGRVAERGCERVGDDSAPGHDGGVRVRRDENVAPVVFRAGCPDCRARFELAASALRLAIGATSRTTFYSFTCPECGAAVRKPAGERIVELLTGGGVRTLRLHVWARIRSRTAAPTPMRGCPAARAGRAGPRRG